MPSSKKRSSPPSPQGPDTLRAFIAASLPEPVLEHVAAVQRTLRKGGFRAKWVRTANMHLTLKFLGNIEERQIADICGAISGGDPGLGPISLHAKGLGVFPNLRRPRVIWVGLSGEVEKLTTLQGALEGSLAAAGFPREDRPYAAHLTVARIRERIDLKKLSDMVERLEKLASEPFEVDRITLFKSDLRPEGPLYTSLFSHILQGP